MTKKATKKIVSLIIALIFSPAVYVQAQSDSQVAEVLVQIEQGRELTSRYKLYPVLNSNKNPTDNYLSLDTQTGKIDLVHWNQYNKGEFRIPVNSVDLTGGNGKVSDIFELTQTNVPWDFILYCKVNGAAWHVHASSERVDIVPIKTPGN